MRTPVWGDAALGVLFAVALVYTAVAIRVSWGGGYWAFDAAAGALVAGCALARRRHLPAAAGAGLVVAAGAILVAWVAGLPQEPGPVAVLALAVLVATAVRTLPSGPAGAVASGGLAVVLGSFAAGGADVVPILNALGWSSAVLAGLALRAWDAQRRATLEDVRREERLEVARELHDVVAHHITGIVVQAQAARLATRRDESLAPLGPSLAGIEDAGTEALAAMRRVVGVLRTTSDTAPTTAGPEELTALLDRFAARHGPTVHRRLPTELPDWPPEIASTVYRIVQESLTNVSQHAPQASTVGVRVTDEGSQLIVHVTDDAPRYHRTGYHRTGYGLAGMRERVESLGGTLHVGPRDDAGWSVRATLPV
ncbi:sensor histidine kinase [Cryptosporangium minutisporangium]|uniref:histidine kinase n=1 Tax=Cryptosporangium minutisporangium TaxID=113569 RepID=A0ABP6SVP7_9ACTN